MEISNWMFVYKLFKVTLYGKVGLSILSVPTFGAIAASTTLVVIPNCKLLSLPPQSFGHRTLYTGESKIIATASSLDILVNAALFTYATFVMHRVQSSRARKMIMVLHCSLLLVLVAAGDNRSRHSSADINVQHHTFQYISYQARGLDRRIRTISCICEIICLEFCRVSSCHCVSL